LTDLGVSGSAGQEHNWRPNQLTSVIAFSFIAYSFIESSRFGLKELGGLVL
jgi:hypothetical protein